MLSDSVFLFQGDPRVRISVSGGGRGFRPPKHDGKGNDGYEKISYRRPLD